MRASCSNFPVQAEILGNCLKIRLKLNLIRALNDDLFKLQTTITRLLISPPWRSDLIDVLRSSSF